MGGVAGVLLIRGVRGLQARFGSIPRTLLPFARKTRFGRVARPAPAADKETAQVVADGTAEVVAPDPTRIGEPAP